ncbi:type I-E CRISPR-associated protein Cas5/CasD [Bifidobacterium sp. CP2]|uniref:type I-E CRISPR-associated protein Cas5/CasD n=1 Tax=Bifidobacterium TaxID=1678 RepID=UPI001BDBBC8E|nr:MULTISPECIES: type I-E CRISPR-associated protein Cas5/CasD [Bifidobacterium]MBT1182141.1 type I-E CRISPR-associated protein Cas5/CasD [Bifidobacterium sp. CP2]MBW3081502.1 type I-E CRISPR-associated protein Cas5/CasD [Bifidobacterium saguinibicoloris]
MSVLLLQLAGPLQSWGDSSRFVRRETRTEPTKSGVIGLLACAQGRVREDPIEDLLGLSFGVRVEQRGRIITDFQTEKSLTRKRNTHEYEKTMPLTYRYYLADARFLVALGAERSALESLDQALRSPRWPLYLGRRSCPPAFPVTLGIHDEYDDVRQALEREPWHASAWYRRRYPDQTLEIVCDASEDEPSATQADLPVTFSQTDRRYAGRAVHRYRIGNPGTEGGGRETAKRNAPGIPPTFDATGADDPMNFA